MTRSSYVSGKRIWLIGASEGIGRALALALAEQGARLIASARQEDRLAQLLGELSGEGHVACAVDVTSEASIENAWRSFAGALPDIILYNAGTYRPMDAQHMELAAVESMIDVNLRGAVRVVAQALPAFVQQGSGHIVLVGSVAGYRGLPSAIGYGASKAGLLHFAENLRADLAGTGVTIQLVSPGFVRTRLTAKNSFKMPFLLSPEQAAQAIAHGLGKRGFEIHFPKAFTYAMKCLALLPYRLYFRLVS